MRGEAILDGAGDGAWDEAVVVALGANLAGRHACVEAGLEAALARFCDLGLTVVKRSGLWRSAAWPVPSDPPFLNAVAIVETALDPAALLQVLHTVEREAGRVRGAANAPRPLDLDLMAYGRRVQEGPPALPHPRAHERRFVMAPLAQIAPTWRHPALDRTALALAAEAPVGRDAVEHASSMSAALGLDPRAELSKPSRWRG